MNRSIAFGLVLSFAVTGCVQEDDNFGEVLPLAQDIRVNLPDDSAGDQQLALGEIGDYYRFTRNITRQFNAGAAWALVLVHAIVQFPPTAVDGETRVWGPHSDALDPAEWRLTVTNNLDGTHDWVFDGRSKTEQDAVFLPLITGLAVEGTLPHRGSGAFTLNLDNARAVNPVDNADDKGIVIVAYDLENTDGTQATLDMDIDTTNDDGDPVDATYHYAENQDGSGDFQFDLDTDLDDDGSLLESAIIRSRWLSDGSGRADVRVQGGDLIDVTVTASECWDQRFRRIYYSDSEEWLPTEGDAATCAFTDQDLPDA